MFQKITILILFLAIIVLVYPQNSTAQDVDAEELPYIQVNFSGGDLVVPPTQVFTFWWDRINFATATTFDWENPTRLRAPRTCLYTIVGQLSFRTLYEGGRAHLYIVRNGIEEDILGIAETELHDLQVVATNVLNEGDYVELRAYIDGEASRRVWNTGDYNPAFSIACINLLVQDQH